MAKKPTTKSPASRSSRKGAAAKPQTKTAARKAARAEKAAKAPKAETPVKKKPAAPARPKAPSRTAAAQALLDLVLRSLDDDKAEQVVTVDVRGRSDVADDVVIATGRSQRHVGAIADHLMRKLKDAGLGAPIVEGLPQGDWVLVDAGDVVVHVFRPEVRTYYNLEGMWSADGSARAAS